MGTTLITRRLAVTGMAVGIGLAGAGVGVANAQGDATATPRPAPITISSAQVRRLCDTRVPKLEAEVAKLVDRINGGADVRGSTQWLRARAKQAQAKGHAERAKRLDARADRRSQALGVLKNVRTRLHDFTTKHCGSGG